MKLLLLSIRSLKRYKLYSIINIMGLALSLACVVLISRYVYSELSTDRFNSKFERLHLLTCEFEKGIPGVRFWSEPGLNDIAIENETTFLLNNDKILYGDRSFDVKIIAVDNVFLDLMDFPLEVGNKNTLFSSSGGVAITRSYAKLLFGNENPIGKKLGFYNGETVTVEGLIGDLPTKSSLTFDLMVPASLNIEKGVSYSLYLLYPGINTNELNRRWDTPIEGAWGGNSIIYQFFPLKQLYFDNHVLKSTQFQKGNYNNLMILLVAAIMIFLIGLFNYINIYTLIQQKRNQEFGIKKVFGSGIHHVIIQLFIENFILIGISLFFAWIVVELAGGLFQSFYGFTQVVRISFDCLLSMGIIFLLPLVVSIYPFIKYISSPTISSLRSSLFGGKPKASRSIFLVFQYALSISLIVVSLFFMKQLDYMLNSDPGFRTKDIIKVQFINMDNYRYSTLDRSAQNEDMKKKREEITKRMNESPLFSKWIFGSSPNGWGLITAKFATEGNELIEAITTSTSSAEYINFSELQLIEGRLWGESETFSPMPVIINETAKMAYGITDINNTSFFQQDLRPNQKDATLNVIGVVKDFQVDHMSKAIPPIVFLYYPKLINPYAYVSAAVEPGKRAEAIQFLRAIHQEIVGGDFSYTFVEDEVAAKYTEDKKVTTIYSIFTFIAILISSMGLFSLSLFDMQLRYKEIAIRKVNGATTSVILKMLLRKYYKLLIIAFIIATPVSWLFLNKYLEDFAYRTPISWWLFAIALLITSCIALITLYWQVKKAAETNPAEAIKSE